MYDLTTKEIKKLINLIKRIDNFNGKWIDLDKSDPFDTWTNALAHEAMQFLYDNKLIIGFDWSSWEEGREFYRNKDASKYNNLDREFILKLLTAIARNDRFYSGAWGELFESGQAQILFKKLLETYKNGK
ncbi:hypothetical protein R84B8_00435 [Treponema sp. R8-4-B8]